MRLFWAHSLSRFAQGQSQGLIWNRGRRMRPLFTRRESGEEGGESQWMSVTYQKECILQNADLAVKYGTCGHSINLGCVVLAAVSEDAPYYSHGRNYERFLGELPLMFPDKSSDQVEDQLIRKENEVYAYRISDKRVRIIISRDCDLNRRLVGGLDLFPVPDGSVA